MYFIIIIKKAWCDLGQTTVDPVESGQAVSLPRGSGFESPVWVYVFSPGSLPSGMWTTLKKVTLGVNVIDPNNPPLSRRPSASPASPRGKRGRWMDEIPTKVNKNVDRAADFL